MTFTYVNHGIVLPEQKVLAEPIGRIYVTPAGKRYPSVTTVLNISPNKAFLKEWRKRVGDEEADKISRQAAGRGTKIHKMGEDYLNNDPNWSKGQMPINLISFRPIKKILDDHVDNIWFQEVALFSNFLRTSGRVDVIAEYDGVLSIIDFKTARRRRERHQVLDYFMQESFYAVAFEERTGVPVKRLVTIMTVEHDEPQIFIENRDDHIRDFMKLRKKFFEINQI